MNFVSYDDMLKIAQSVGSGGSTGSGINTWAASTSYAVGNLVLYNYDLYICETAHTSSATFDAQNWHIIGSGGGGQVNVTRDILWSGGSSSETQSTTFTLSHPYTDYDYIIVNVQGNQGTSMASNEMSPASGDDTLIISYAIGDTYQYNIGLTFSGTTASFAWRSVGASSVAFINRIEGIKLNGGSLVSDFTGATSGTDGIHGLVPAPLAGDEAKFLRGDGTWGSVASSGLNLIVDELANINLVNINTSGDTSTLSKDIANYDYYWMDFGGGTCINKIDNNAYYEQQSSAINGLNISCTVSGTTINWNWVRKGANFNTAYSSGYFVKVYGIKLCNPNVYKTTEQRIGTWIDGKPLYQVTITGTTPSTAGQLLQISLSSYNLVHMVDMSGHLGANSYIPLSVYDGNRYVDISVDLSNIELTTSYTNTAYEITIKYTKNS